MDRAIHSQINTPISKGLEGETKTNECYSKEENYFTSINAHEAAHIIFAACLLSGTNE
jgi:hypothetical protein